MNSDNDHQKIQEIQSKLQQELSNTSGINSEYFEQAQQFSNNMHQLLIRTAEEEEYQTLLDQAIYLESQFAISHPVMEKTFREVIDALGKMGI